MALEKDILMYKGKALSRCGNEIYYGSPEDKYILVFKVKETEKFQDLDIAKTVIVELRTNDSENSKLMKQGERDSLYKAFDLGEFWLEDALANH